MGWSWGCGAGGRDGRRELEAARRGGGGCRVAAGVGGVRAAEGAIARSGLGGAVWKRKTGGLMVCGRSCAIRGWGWVGGRGQRCRSRFAVEVVRVRVGRAGGRPAAGLGGRFSTRRAAGVRAGVRAERQTAAKCGASPAMRQLQPGPHGALLGEVQHAGRQAQRSPPPGLPWSRARGLVAVKGTRKGKNGQGSQAIFTGNRSSPVAFALRLPRSFDQRPKVWRSGWRGKLRAWRYSAWLSVRWARRRRAERSVAQRLQPRILNQALRLQPRILSQIRNKLHSFIKIQETRFAKGQIC